ncbi:MAG: hypothetical protein AAF226_06980 [Verrucomicrobiota bacterium]
MSRGSYSWTLWLWPTVAILLALAFIYIFLLRPTSEPTPEVEVPSGIVEAASNSAPPEERVVIPSEEARSEPDRVEQDPPPSPVQEVGSQLEVKAQPSQATPIPTKIKMVDLTIDLEQMARLGDSAVSYRVGPELFKAIDDHRVPEHVLIMNIRGSKHLSDEQAQQLIDFFDSRSQIQSVYSSFD